MDEQKTQLKMVRKQPTIASVVMLGCTVFVAGLLAWSINQTASLKIKALAATDRIAEFDIEVATLSEELVAVKLELKKANSILADNNLQMALLAGQGNRAAVPEKEEITEIVSPTPAVIGSDVARDEQLDDMPHPQQASRGLTAGNRALSKLDYNNAIENFAKVEADTADFISARMGVANAYFYSHQYAKAVTEFTNVLEHQPESAEAIIGLANAHQRLGQREQQIAAYDRVIDLEPEQWLHYNSRATAHMMNGDNDRATQDFLKAARLADPVRTDQATALENIGLIHLREEQWQQAFQHANKVNELDVQHSWNWLIRGVAAAKLERNLDAYVSFDTWFKYKRSTDPYLLKQYLPESIYAFVDVSPAGLAKLVDPPLISGQHCDNDSQCRSNICRPGPPSNKFNYCVAANKNCSAPDSNGYRIGEKLVVEGVEVRCYQPESANARWTVDSRSAK